jgi:hypothetical protein
MVGAQCKTLTSEAVGLDLVKLTSRIARSGVAQSAGRALNAERSNMMASTNTKKQMTAQRINPAYQNLRIRNISVDTSTRDLVELFSQQQFSVMGVEIHLICPEDLTGMQAIVTLPTDEAAAAYRWANGRSWRGQNLDVVVQPEGRQ